MSIWQRFLGWCTPEGAPPSVARQHRIVATVVVTFMGIAGAFVPPCWWLGYTGTTLGHGAAGLMGVVALFALRRSGPVLAAHLTAVACCVTLVPYITLAGGFDYDFFFWFLIVPLCAGLLGGQRAGVIWSVLIGVLVLGYTLLHTAGYRIPAREMVNPPALLVVSQSLTMVFMVGATMFIFQQNQKWEAQQTRMAIEKLEVEVQERRLAEAHARRANRAKNTFLATMSHELRTPMNGVLGMSQLLLLEAQPPEQRKYTEALKDSAELLMELLDSLLDFSKIEEGHLMLERRVFSLPGLLHSAANLMGGRARQQSLELTVFIDPALPEWIWGDELRLRQMVLNLLSNAIKFTPEGSVTLRARAEGAAAMRVEVEDTGIGIDEAAQESLFEPFTQADAATTRKYGGTGLGLAIVASLAEAMGGAVTVASSPGKGSTFALCLPVEAGRSPEALPAPETERERGTRVLVVEDNPVNRLVAERFLVELGCEVRLAADGVEALEQLEAEAVDVVLMDMHMPRMDGLGATREIRSRMGGALPVVGLTASVTEDDRQACFSAGMNAVLCKPLMMDDLREVLDRYEPTHRDSEA